MRAHSSKAKRERDASRNEHFSFSVEDDPEPAEPQHFAVGTRSMEKLSAACDELEAELDLELVPNAAFLIGAKGRIEDANATAATLVGYTRAQLVGELVSRVICDLDLTPSPGPGVRAIPAASGLVVHHAGGDELPASALLCPHTGGAMIVMVTPLTGVTHASSENDVAEIVHDFKSPLATIALEMYMLGEKLTPARHAEVDGALSRITHNLLFLDRMIQNLLDSCAIDAGELVVRPKPTELRTLLEQVIDRVVATRDRDRVFLEAPCMMTVSIDDLRIERVVANLLQNALKYAPRGSGIVVRLDISGNVARVSVIDAGPGLTAAESTYVFDRYRRTSSARVHEGSGLGLYVSKQIIAAHGGRIGVESVHGAGSRFFFELPIA